MTASHMRMVIPYGAVLDTAIVPKGDGVVLPIETALKFRRRDMLEQEIEQGPAFACRETFDPDRKS